MPSQVAVLRTRPETVVADYGRLMRLVKYDQTRKVSWGTAIRHVATVATGAFLTLLLALAVAAGLVALFVAVIASPYLLIRHLHAHRKVPATPRASRHLFRKHRVSSGPLRSLQPKGMS